MKPSQKLVDNLKNAIGKLSYSSRVFLFLKNYYFKQGFQLTEGSVYFCFKRRCLMYC